MLALSQAASNLLWAWAVADRRQHRALLHKLHDAFLSLQKQGRVARLGMSQAHQYQLWVEYELCEPSLLFDASLRVSCREAMEATHTDIHVSGLQGHVARVLRKLGLAHQLELNLCGYSVDLALPDHRIVIEVDG